MEISLTTHETTPPYLHKNDLTDDEIHQLLLEAEGRLQAPLSTCSKNQADPSRIAKLSLDHSVRPYIRDNHDIAAGDAMRIINTSQSNRPMEDWSKVVSSRSSVTDKDQPTAGNNWFNLPKTELTPELKRDLQLLRMRSILDPKRHYKKETSKAHPPEFSQFGTIIESPTEFFSGRIAKRDRKKNFVDETLAIERQTKRFEARYKDVQSIKQSGKKAFYRSLRQKRQSKGR